VACPLAQPVRVQAHQARHGTAKRSHAGRSGSPDRIRDSNYVGFLDQAAAMGLHVHFSTATGRTRGAVRIIPNSDRPHLRRANNCADMYGVGMEEPSQSKTDKINEYLDLVMDHPALLAYVRSGGTRQCAGLRERR